MNNDERFQAALPAVFELVYSRVLEDARQIAAGFAGLPRDFAPEGGMEALFTSWMLARRLPGAATERSQPSKASSKVDAEILHLLDLENEMLRLAIRQLDAITERTRRAMAESERVVRFPYRTIDNNRQP